MAIHKGEMETWLKSISADDSEYATFRVRTFWEYDRSRITSALVDPFTYHIEVASPMTDKVSLVEQGTADLSAIAAAHARWVARLFNV